MWQQSSVKTIKEYENQPTDSKISVNCEAYTICTIAVARRQEWVGGQEKNLGRNSI